MASVVRALGSGMKRCAAILRRALSDRCGLAAFDQGGVVGLRAGRLTLGWQVALTFDDGPLWPRTGEILDVLRRRGVTASFFVVGKMVNSRSYALLRRILREGHILGNHGYHHLVDMLLDPRAETLVRAELRLTQAVVDLALLARSGPDFLALRRRLLGQDRWHGFAAELPDLWPAMEVRWREILRERRPGRPESPHAMVFVRPPGGSPFGGRFTEAKKRLYGRLLAELGLVNVLWDEETSESDPRLPEAERRDPGRQAASLEAGARKGGILLVHDRIAPGALDLALERLAEAPAVRFQPLSWLAARRFGCSADQVSLALSTLHFLAPWVPSERIPRPL